MTEGSNGKVKTEAVDYDDDYDDRELGCANCDMGWRHGCCDDLCYGSCDDAQWCYAAIPCRHCNPHGDFLP